MSKILFYTVYRAVPMHDCKWKIRINRNFGNNLFFLISSDTCHKKMLLESLNIPLSEGSCLYKSDISCENWASMKFPWTRNSLLLLVQTHTNKTWGAEPGCVIWYQCGLIRELLVDGGIGIAPLRRGTSGVTGRGGAGETFHRKGKEARKEGKQMGNN